MSWHVSPVIGFISSARVVDVRGSGGRMSRRAVVWKAATLGRLSLMKAGFEALDVVELRMEDVIGLALAMHWVLLLALAACRSNCDRMADAMMLSARDTSYLCCVTSLVCCI